MAVSFAYGDPTLALSARYTISRTSGGGVNFSENLPYNSTNFDYFDDDSVVDDALYISAGLYGGIAAGFTFNVGVPVSATTFEVLWEYYAWRESTGKSDWYPIEDIIDHTEGFTIAGENMVEFPQQWQPKTRAVNGSSSTTLWIRCRIVAVSGLTEGGSQADEVVLRGTGQLSISGSTEEDPMTFQRIYDWIKENKPHISVTRTGDEVYDFTKVGIRNYGWIESYNETIMFGMNCLDNIGSGGNLMYNMHSGKRVGNRGYDGSIFIIYGTGNTSVFSIKGSDSEYYGCYFKDGQTANSNGKYPGYMDLYGTFVDTVLEVAPKMYAEEVTNCKLNGYFLLAGSFDTVFNGFTNLCANYSMFYTYGTTGTGFEMKAFDWGFVGTSGRIMYFYRDAYRSSPVYDFIDPVTPLGSLGDVYNPVYRAVGGRVAFTNVFFESVSDGVFTDLTTEAGSTTTDDIPLGGEIGDSYYFNAASNYKYSNLEIEKTTEENDYEYAWEYWYGGDWYPIGETNFWDGTEGMSKSGFILQCTSKPQAIASSTVNGVSGYWYRARITKKGTITPNPTATRIRKFALSGCGDWTIRQRYSVNLKVVDVDGVAIEGASVVATYPDGTPLFSVETAADGTIEEQLITQKEFVQDVDCYADNFIKETEYPEFNLTISKTGHWTHKAKNLSLVGKIDWVTKLSNGDGTKNVIYNSTLYGSTIR